MYQVGKNAALFEQVNKFLINHIQKTFRDGGDLATALRDETEYDFEADFAKPILMSVPGKVDDPNVIAARDQARIVFENQSRIFESRRDRYRQNKRAACALLWEHCTKEMQARIRQDADYDKAIVDDPIKLMQIIRSKAHSFRPEEYDVVSVIRALREFANFNQYFDEDIKDFGDRFTAMLRVFKTQFGGLLIIPKLLPTLEAEIAKGSKTVVLDLNEAQKIWERTLAYSILQAGDTRKYGSLMTTLKTQKSLHNDQYPKTVETALEALKQHTWDPAFKEEKKKRAENRRTQNQSQSSAATDEPVMMSFAQILKRLCWVCGSDQHMANQCSLRLSTPSDQWFKAKCEQADAIMKSHQHLTTVPEKTTTSDATSVASTPTQSTAQPSTTVPAAPFASKPDQEKQDHWEYVSSLRVEMWPEHQQHRATNEYFKGKRMQDLIVYDTATSSHSVNQKKYLKNIRKAIKPAEITTGGGIIVEDTIGDVEGLVDAAYYSPQAPTTLISHAGLKDSGINVQYDNEEDLFTMELKDRTLLFRRTPNNLYAHDPNDSRFTRSIMNQSLQCMQIKPLKQVETVESNSKFYTPRQLARAKEARRLLQVLGFPTIEALKEAIRLNIIRDNPVTIQDCEIATSIYGPDVASLKGKLTRRKPDPVNQTLIEMPEQFMERQGDVTLAIDTMFIAGDAYLTSYARNLKYRTCCFIPDREVSSYWTALDTIFTLYNAQGYNITEIHADQEFKPVLNPIKHDLNIRVVYAPSQQHVPEAERNNRVIKERIRATLHAVPYKAVPRIMLRYLATHAAHQLNLLPSKDSVYPTYSPWTMITGQQLVYKHHCQFPFGSYAIAHDEPDPSSTMQRRGKDAIYLRPSPGDPGGHEVLDLTTRRVINRRKLTIIPITPSVIRTVEAMAERDRIKPLNLTDFQDQPLHDSAWIAGVDYTYTPPPQADAPLHDDDEHEPETDEEEDDEPTQDVNPIEVATDIEELYPPVPQPQPAIPIPVPPRRTTRTIQPPQSYEPTMTGQTYQYLTAGVPEDTTVCRAAANLITDFRARFLQTYTLNKGLKHFGEPGREAALNETKQLHERECFAPVRSADLTPQEKQRATESFMFLVQKKSGRIKARTVSNGSTQRLWMGKEDSSSPTVSIDALFMTSMIDAYEHRRVATADIPNAFIQTPQWENDRDGNRFIMKLRGPLVDMLLEVDPYTYEEFVEYEQRNKVLYLVIKKAIYGMLQSALLFYLKLSTDLQQSGFKLNPYEPCVANKMVNGKQLTVVWHVDDMKMSHEDPRVLESFIDWLTKKYGELKAPTIVRGDKHFYLGMTIDYSERDCVKIDMRDYVQEMLDEYPDPVTPKSKTPANEKLFVVNESSPRLPEKKSNAFHHTVAKGLFLAKRARPDILTTIAFLCTRVQNPTVEDWSKLHKLMQFLKRTKEDVMKLKLNHPECIHWYVDAAYGVHPDMKSHTGYAMSLGDGCPIAGSSKQKINTRSSSQAELVAVDDAIGKILWTKRFLEEQGLVIKHNIVFQDNQSTILLEKNGRRSAGKRSRHINVKYFYITDQLQRNELEIQYCPTDQMVSDYLTKALQGNKFERFRKIIMNIE